MEINILGKRIKKLREASNISQITLSKHLNISNTTLSQYETGKRIPSDEIKNKLADYFNVSLDYLLGRTNNKNAIDIPQEYTDEYKVTSKDKKQYIEHMKKANEAFFMNDEFNEEDKKEILDTMNEIFWKAKAMNKRKPKDE